MYHQRIQLNTSEVSLLQVEGIGRNIVPVFYAVTRPASINFPDFSGHSGVSQLISVQESYTICIDARMAMNG